MKKLLIFIMLFSCLFITSCKDKDNDDDKKEEDKTYHYDFIEKEDIVSSLTTYAVDIEFIGNDNKKVYYSIVENELFFYYASGTNEFLVEKSSNKIYSLDSANNVKVLEKQINYDYNSTREIVIDFLSSHLEIADSKYVKNENPVNVGSLLCDEYELTVKSDKKNYLSSFVYVDQTYGFCLKKYVESATNGEVTTTYWQINKLSFDTNTINSSFDKYETYTEEVAPLEWTKWPDEGLLLLIPEFKGAEVVLAVDYGNNALINMTNISLSQIRGYASSLKNYGYKDYVSGTNEAGQVIFVTYNDDNVLVKMTYIGTLSSFTIRVYNSSIEEINKEISKLQ